MARVDTRSAEFETSNGDVFGIITEQADARWSRAAYIEFTTFRDAGYVKTQTELDDEYAPYLSASRFILGSRDEVDGAAVRVITDNDAGFKTINDINEGRLNVSERGEEIIGELPLASTMEVGTLGVAKEFRGHDADRLSVGLYGVIFGITMREEITDIVASFDRRYFMGFRALFGESVTKLGPKRDYMGSYTIPAHIDPYQLMEHTEDQHPDLYKHMLDAASKVQ